MTAIKLIVGLGNPGRDYEATRHNAGVWFVEKLAADYSSNSGGQLVSEPKFFGRTARITLDSHDVRLLVPSTYMNLSGKAVGALATFYRIAPEEILVAHDELDIFPGTARFKKGGGHGGHNGLKDIISALANSKDFYRLRIGIGHPGSAAKVHGYVLGKPSAPDKDSIEAAIDEACRCLPDALAGKWPLAMNKLHSFKHP